jgi:hypothetical protein
VPWRLQKLGNGYVVATKATGRTHSKHPMSKAKAQAQMRALYASEKN